MEFIKTLERLSELNDEQSKIKKELWAHGGQMLGEWIKANDLSLRKMQELTGKHFTYWAHIRAGRTKFSNQVVKDILKVARGL